MNNNRFYTLGLIIVILIMSITVSCNSKDKEIVPEQEITYMIYYYIEAVDEVDVMYYDNLEDCIRDMKILDEEDIWNEIDYTVLD